MDTMKNNIESLASWINSLNEQPLDIDYIRIYNYTDDLPKEKASWFESIRFDFLRLLSSFTSEYNIKNSSDEVKSLTVWASVGRDQLKVLRIRLQPRIPLGCDASIRRTLQILIRAQI